jgi:hypothetical protein
VSRSNPVLADFQAECQKYYALYVLAVSGLQSRRKHFKNAKPNQKILFSDKDPTKHAPTATLLVSDLYQFTRKDGAFADALAKSLIVTIYAEWEERYRGAFAKDRGVSKRQIRFRLMGDLRKLRNRIVHARGDLRPSDVIFETLSWRLEPGPLLITQEMFAGLIKQLGDFVVEVETDEQAT